MVDPVPRHLNLIGVNQMMRTRNGESRRSGSRQFALTALLVGGFLSLTAGAIAAPLGEPDIPTMKSAPEARTVEQEIKLANDYFVGHGVVQDFGQSAYWFERAAGAGDAQAQMQIGYFYEAGIGVPKDLERAAHWYQIAASNGSATAKVSLGTLYFWGTGVQEDRQLAAQLYRQAAAKGSGLAAYYLGDMYYSGAGVAQDEAAGERWYEKGAEMHNAQAEYDLGLLFFDRVEHAHDVRRAAVLLRESADADYVPAMYSLGLLLLKNPNLAKSTDVATVLLERSAKAGIWKSSLLLGVLARDGRGVPADASAAYYHFRVATLQGGDDAKNLLEADIRRLMLSLGPEQTALLDSEAESWYGQHRNVLEFVYRGGNDRAKYPNYALAVPENGTHTVEMLPNLNN